MCGYYQLNLGAGVICGSLAFFSNSKHIYGVVTWNSPCDKHLFLTYTIWAGAATSLSKTDKVHNKIRTYVCLCLSLE